MTRLALVVENDAATRKLLEAMLRRLDLEVDLVAAPASALALLEAVDYDLVLLELFFPGASGGEILSWLQQNRPDALQRTVVVSSAPLAELRKIGTQWPSVRRIQKPFELSEILDIVGGVTAAPSRGTGAPFEEFVRRSVRAGARSAVIVAVLDTDVKPIATYGCASGTIEPSRPLPLDANVPICDALRTRTPIWIAALGPAAETYPRMVELWRNDDSRALCALPIIRNDAAIGAVAFSFREPRLFTETEQQAFMALAELAAGLIEAKRDG